MVWNVTLKMQTQLFQRDHPPCLYSTTQGLILVIGLGIRIQVE